MGGTGYSNRHSYRHPNEVICATFDSAGTTIDVVREVKSAAALPQAGATTREGQLPGLPKTRSPLGGQLSVDTLPFLSALQDGEIFIQGPASFFADASNPFIELHVDLSAECQEGTIYKSIFITYNLGGHPTIDFFGGGYGVPHW